jgi:glycosyltransferase involved in cell wall biosynthesis
MNAYETGKPVVSVVIPCRNERTEIEAAICSILAQEAPAGSFEVIVADGMSDDGTRPILTRLSEKHPRLRVVDNPGGIVSSGLNIGIQQARGEIIIRMDAHTNYAPDYISQCVQVLKETGADSVGGPWVAIGNSPRGRAIAAAFQSPFGSGGARGHNTSYSGPVDTVYLGCWRREIFDRIGFFDEEFVRNQDDEFNLRLRRSGGTVWQSVKIKSWYHPRESLRRLFQQYLQYGYWKACVLRKHRLPASIRHILPATFVLTVLVLSICSVFSATAFTAWVALLSVYIALNISVSFATAGKNGWNLLLFLPAVFATFHFAYGWGFLRGFADFIILRRKTAPAYSALTRTSSGQLNL